MENVFTLIVFSMLSISASASQKPAEFKFTNEDGLSCVALYETAKITSTELANASYFTHELAGASKLRALNLCNQNLDTRYKECGERKYGSKNFLWNAKVNLEANDTIIAECVTKRVPSAFEKSKLQVVRDLKFTQWLEQTVYSYLDSRNSKVLFNAAYEKLDFKSCQIHLKSISASITQQAVEQIAAYDWQNCVNHLWNPATTEDARVSWKKLIVSESCQEPNENRD